MIRVEEFEYNEGGLKKLYWHYYTPGIHLLTQNIYTFFRDGKGNLSTHIVEMDDF